jgi:hypothetical protein
MKAIVVSLALLAGQMITMQEKPVVHLKPHQDTIEAGYGGMLLELDHSPQALRLPKFPPKPDPQGAQWSVDVKNFGPWPVTVQDYGNFSVKVNLNQTVHI